MKLHTNEVIAPTTTYKVSLEIKDSTDTTVSKVVLMESAGAIRYISGNGDIVLTVPCAIKKGDKVVATVSGFTAVSGWLANES